MNSTTNNSDKKQLEQLINEAIETELNEGLFDFLKQTAQKSKKQLAKGWQNVKDKFGAAVDNFRNALLNKVNAINDLKKKLDFVPELQNEIEQEAGQKLPVTSEMQTAQKLPELAEGAQVEIQKDRNKAMAQVRSMQPQQQEAMFNNMAASINTINEEFQKQNKQKLNEALTATTVIGLILGVLGGVPLLLKALHKLAKKFNFTKTSEAIHHAYEVAHHIEGKAIDWGVPDKVSYVMYKKAWNKGFKTSKEFLEYEQYQNSQAKTKVEHLMYRLILVYFLLNGLAGVLHAGASLLGAAEATASTVKAVEIAAGVADAASMVEG